MLSPSLDWSQWRPLTTCWADRNLISPGLYRIRRVGRRDLDYIGQTSLQLRERLGMLKGVYRSEMPYRDPHTVGPALWAQRQLGGEDYEASTCPVEGDARWRKAQECVAIALYRQEHRRSPTFNFGRMPDGYRMSSANNARLVSVGRRFRGGITDAPDSSHLPSLCPVGSIQGDACDEDWCGHAWSPWVPLTSTNIALPNTAGLYRIRGDRPIVYIGQGTIADRLRQHLRSARFNASPQGQALAAAQPLTCSWVVNENWANHQRLELENDLIAAYILATGASPVAQFYSHGASHEGEWRNGA
jgi:hypothetical protein